MIISTLVALLAQEWEVVLPFTPCQDMLTVAAMLSVEAPFVRPGPLEALKEATERHEEVRGESIQCMPVCGADSDGQGPGHSHLAAGG